MRLTLQVLRFVALTAVLSCSTDRVSAAPRIVTQYITSEPSRVLWPLSYYSDASVAHFLLSEQLKFDDTGRMLTRSSAIVTHDLVTGAKSSVIIEAHMSVQRKGNTLLLGAPDVCPPHADCTAGRSLRVPTTGILIEGAGRFGSDSLVFGPIPALISRTP